MATWETAVELARALPEVEEGTGYGRPALKVGGKVFACIGREGDEILAARVGFEERDFLLRSEPDVFFVTPHYANWPWVLVRLEAVDGDALRDVLTEAWLFRAPRKLAQSFEPPTA